jgi:hypothetical protein
MQLLRTRLCRNAIGEHSWDERTNKRDVPDPDTQVWFSVKCHQVPNILALHETVPNSARCGYMSRSALLFWLLDSIQPPWLPSWPNIQGPRNQHGNMSACTWYIKDFQRLLLGPFPWVNITSGVPAAARYALAWKVVCPLVVSMGHCSGTRSMQSGRQGSPSPGTHHNTKVWLPFGQVELISLTCEN